MGLNNGAMNGGLLLLAAVHDKLQAPHMHAWLARTALCMHSQADQNLTHQSAEACGSMRFTASGKEAVSSGSLRGGAVQQKRAAGMRQEGHATCNRHGWL